MNKIRRISLLTVVLVAGYILFQILADITAVKIVAIFGLFLPGGTMIYALTFTWRDMMHKWLGKRTTVHVIWIAALCNVAMAMYFAFVAAIPSAPFWGGQDCLVATLSLIPRIVFASIVAELISELIDTEAFAIAQKRGWPQWLRVLGSNAVSLPLDSVIFAALAFGGVMPVTDILQIIYAQIILKAAITVISLPLIYLIPTRPPDFLDGILQLPDDADPSAFAEAYRATRMVPPSGTPLQYTQEDYRRVEEGAQLAASQARVVHVHVSQERADKLRTSLDQLKVDERMYVQAYLSGRPVVFNLPGIGSPDDDN